MKKEINCPECDTFFTIKYKTADPIQYCVFCGGSIEEEETNEFEDVEID